MLTSTASFLAGAALNLLVAVVIVRFIYYPLTENKSFVFTFLAFNTTLYFVLSVLTSMDVSIGLGFGLFAIFSILRYRTDPIPIREMTYLFVVIALPVMNSVMVSNGELVELLVANVVIVAMLYVLERAWGFRYEASKRVIYEKIDLIAVDRRAELIEDLRTRTGLPVKRVHIARIDFVRDIADLTVYYDEPLTIELLARSESQQHWELDHEGDDVA